MMVEAITGLVKVTFNQFFHKKHFRKVFNVSPKLTNLYRHTCTIYLKNGSKIRLGNLKYSTDVFY